MVAAEALDVSLIIPLFNEESNVPLLYPKLVEVLEKLGKSFEVIFVDDGSTDGTFEELKKLHAQDNRVRAISFTTNYGKSGGYAAGFEAAVGDVVITMDGDLQDDPADIPKVLEAIEKGADLVVGWKTEGADAVGGKSLPSWIFNRVAQRLTQLKIHDMNCPFKAYRNYVAKTIGQEIYGELFRYQPLIARRKGYKIAEVEVANLPRQHGTSKYGFSKFLRGFLDLFTILFLTRYMMRPLHLFGTVGMITSFIGAAIILALYVNKFITSTPIGNYMPLFILSILMVIFGVQFFSIGLVSEMIAQKDKTSSDKFTIKTTL